MKVTKDQVNQIKQLKEKGLSLNELFLKLKLPRSTIEYYYSEKRREGAINYQKKYQKENPPKRGDKYKDYQREYHKKRYWKLKNLEEKEKGGKNNE